MYSKRTYIPLYKHEYIKDAAVESEEERIESSSPADIPIYIREISKTYDKNNLAVYNVSFGVDIGEIFCLLGTNGAGKTTTFSTMTSQIVANKGDVRISNIDVVTQYSQARRLIGIVYSLCLCVVYVVYIYIYIYIYRLLPPKNVSL